MASMKEPAPVLGAIVPNSEPAIFPGNEALLGRFVILERMKESDFLPLWSTVGAYPQLWTHWPEGPYENATQFSDSLNKLLSDSNIVLYTIFRDGDAVGSLILQPADLGSRVIEMGLFYGPTLQRTREATEGMYLLMCLVFDKLNNRRLEWKTDRLNTSSRKAAERYGLVYEGCLRQHRIFKGRNRDTVWYSMLDSEWPICKQAFKNWLDDANFDDQGRQKKRLGDIRESLHTPAN